VRKLSAAFFLLAFVNAAPAQWTAKDVRDEPSTDARVIHRHVDLVDSANGANAMVDLALFSTKTGKLRVIDNHDSTNLEPVVQSSGCLAAVNGGYFDPSFAPLGLRIIDGKTTSRLTRGRLLTGVIASGSVTEIFRVGEFSSRRKWNAAVECGPFLVDLGRPVRGLESTREARRTFVASGSNDRAALGYCPSATLAELAQILTGRIGDFKIQRALNLDGGSSSAFWFKGEKGVVYYPEQKTVRDFVAIVPK
jgi:Phosphodiester glycosidase